MCKMFIHWVSKLQKDYVERLKIISKTGSMPNEKCIAMQL